MPEIGETITIHTTAEVTGTSKGHGVCYQVRLHQRDFGELLEL